jgi:mannose-6-phosphate isomerase
MYPLKMRPAFKEYLWGGKRLAELYGKKSGAETTAESWEISCHPNGVSAVANGPFAGYPLDILLSEHPQLCGDLSGQPFPVLIKLIDAKQKLSLQVHPAGEQGKNEMWHILDAAPDSEIIAGFKEHVTRGDFLVALQNGTLPDIVRHIPVKPGDCICVPAGLIHGIGEGILLAEVQQSSDVTYRVYDYGRLDADGKPRPLHIEEAAAALDFALKPVITRSTQRFYAQKEPVYTQLTDWPYFTSGVLSVNGIVKMPPEKSFCAIVVTAGSVSINAGNKSVFLAAGESAFIPANLSYELEGGADLLVTRV